MGYIQNCTTIFLPGYVAYENYNHTDKKTASRSNDTSLTDYIGHQHFYDKTNGMGYTVDCLT